MDQQLFINSLGGGVGIYLFFQGVKALCGRFGWQPGQLIHVLAMVTSVALAGLECFLHFKSLPAHIFGVSAVSIYAFTQVAYNFIKGTNSFLSTYSAGKAALAAPATSAAPAIAAAAVTTPTTAQPTAPIETQPVAQPADQPTDQPVEASFNQ